MARVIRSAGGDIAAPAGTAGVQETSARLLLPAGTVQFWVQAHGDALILALEFSLPRAQGLAFSTAPLQVTWTGLGRRCNSTVLSIDNGQGIYRYLPAAGELGATAHIRESSNRRFCDDAFLLPRTPTQRWRAIRTR